MKFKALRACTLTHLGHVVVFAKGQTRELPPVLHSLAVEEGLEPELEKGEIAPEAGKAPEADAARIAKLKEALIAIRTKNDTKDFTAGGIPKVKVVELASGERPENADELAKLWAEVNAEG